MTDVLPLTDLRARVSALLPQLRADLEELIRIPSVSSDPAAAPELARSAARVAELLREAGLTDVEVLSVPGGQPAVVGSRPAPPGAPTVLLYAHHDVQPTGARSEWDSEPFEPTVRDGRLYARGAADDKAGIAVHLAALRAFGDDLPVGVTVLIEGEEEIGSPTLAAFLAAHTERLASDVLVLADSSNWAIGVPALTVSLRGLVDCVVEVRTLSHGIHSGMYGGPLPDALTTLCRLLATLHDDSGAVAVEGLGGGESDPLDLTEERFRAEAGAVEGLQLLGSGSLTSRLWSQPAISVIGIDAPTVAAASNTLLPVARAMVSLRVPPGTVGADAMAALVAHLTTHAPWGAQVSVEPGSIGEPFAATASSWAHEAARSAFAEAWDGVPSVDVGVGGSIPFIASFASAFPSAAVLVTGVEDPDTRAHGANESLHLAEFARACLAETLLLARLGAGDPGAL